MDKKAICSGKTPVATDQWSKNTKVPFSDRNRVTVGGPQKYRHGEGEKTVPMPYIPRGRG